MNPFQHMLYTVIMETFHQEQVNAEKLKQEQDDFDLPVASWAMKVRFDLPIPEGFEGYRQITLILYCPPGSTYTQVWIRTTATLASLPCEGSPMGGLYKDSASAWTKIADHSSCWREGVEKALATPGIRGLVTGGKGDKGWYNLVEVPNFTTPAEESL